MQTYTIPADLTIVGTITLEANSEEEARDIAYDLIADKGEDAFTHINDREYNIQ